MIKIFIQHFYVAITRARKQLWLLESSAETTTGILHVLEHSAKEPLVEVVRPTDRNVEKPPFVRSLIYCSTETRF
jgi:superfamily I DNA/RNA helicase